MFEIILYFFVFILGVGLSSSSKLKYSQHIINPIYTPFFLNFFILPFSSLKIFCLDLDHDQGHGQGRGKGRVEDQGRWVAPWNVFLFSPTADGSPGLLVPVLRIRIILAGSGFNTRIPNPVL